MLHTTSMIVRKAIILCAVILLVPVSCSLQRDQQEKPSEDVLDRYSTQSERTDPGSYSNLYDPLPHSCDSLNRLIKCLLIHPLEAAQMNMDLETLPSEGTVPTVEKLLEKLNELDPTGLQCPRKIADRMVVACYHHVMLLTSILRYQGIPARMRAGFSRYYEKEAGVRFGHIICQMWDEKEGEWIMVDPDRGLVDMDPDDFDFPYQAWDNVRNKKRDAGIYISSVSAGLKGIINLMVLDAALVQKDEKLYWDLPRIVMQDISSLGDLDPEIISVLDELSDCFKTPESRLEEISELYYGTGLFRPTGMDYDSYFQMIMEQE